LHISLRFDNIIRGISHYKISRKKEEANLRKNVLFVVVMVMALMVSLFGVVSAAEYGGTLVLGAVLMLSGLTPLT